MESRKTGRRIRPASAWNGLTQLAVLAICFAIGALGGFLFATIGEPSSELLDYLQRYFQLAGQGGQTGPSLLSSIWDLLRWPLAAVLLGFSALGIAGIPVLLAVRGFMLSFAAATFTRLFGWSGAAAAMASFGLTVFVAVPVLFLISQNAFQQSLKRLSGSASKPDAWGQWLSALIPGLSLLILAVALQHTVMPALLTAVCARLFAP